MDAFEWEYLQENTTVVRNVRVPHPFERDARIQFAAIMEDMDRPNLVIVREGVVVVEKMQTLDEEVVKRVLEDSFGLEAWKHADSRLPFSLHRGRVALQTQGVRQHEQHSSLEAAVKCVADYPTNSQRLIFQTLGDGWRQGVFVACIENLRWSLKESQP